jgi:ATP-binding cassette, subfamily C, bacterial
MMIAPNATIARPTPFARLNTTDGVAAAIAPRRGSLLAGCRAGLAAAAGFSLLINLLLLTVPLYTMQVFDRVLASRSRETLLYLTVIAVGALLLLGWLELVRARLLQEVGGWLERRLAPQGLLRALGEPPRPQPYGAQALRDVAQLRQCIAGPTIGALMDAPWAPVYLVVLWLLHPLLGAVAAGGVVVLFALALLNELLTRRPLAAASDAAVATLREAEVASRNREAAAAMGMAPALVTRWAWRNDDLLRRQAIAANRSNAILALSRFARLAVQVLLLAAGAALVVDHAITAGAMMAGSILMARALAPVEQAIGSWRGLADARAAHRRMAAYLARPDGRRTSMALPRPEGRLSVERVTFAPASGTPPVLRGVSFELAPGRALAVLGPSGAGKSTLARLLVGAWPPLSGSIRLDGADVFAWDRAEFGRHVGYLPQDVELFPGTVAENIARMADGARAEDVIEAARLAGIHDLVLRLPAGYDTRVGEDGLALSGGQRQRLALARALFGDPRLVVLDEPNANLDGDGEAALLRAITRLKERGATVVAVTHRPSLLRAVDDVLVLRDGGVELFGPRDEVLPKLTGPRPATQPLQAAATVQPVQTTRAAV